MSDSTAKKRKPKGQSPNARSLLECRRRGWLAQGVEQTIPHTFIKRDLFHCIDIVALDGQLGVLGIQATGDNGGDVQKRVRKIALECGDAALRWLGAGNRLVVWGWGRRVGTGRMRWVLREVEVTALMIVAAQGDAERGAREVARA